MGALRERAQGARHLPRPGAAPGVPPLRGVRVVSWAGYRAALSYTFDDSSASQLEHFERLVALGAPMTFYLWTGRAESESPVWRRALELGHELGNHSHSHQQSGSALGADLDRGTRFIEEHHQVHPWTMAAPYGSRDYVPAAAERFFVNRGVQPGLVLPLGVSNPHSLECFVPRQGACAVEFNAHTDAAREAGAWQIVLVHGFSGGSDAAYQPVAISEFEAAVRYAQGFGDVWIGTLVDVAAYWLGEKALHRAQLEELADGGLRYQWTLPSHFPPGKRVRILAAPGSVSQLGDPVEPAPSGDYDICLDAGELRWLPEGRSPSGSRVVRS